MIESFGGGSTSARSKRKQLGLLVAHVASPFLHLLLVVIRGALLADHDMLARSERVCRHVVQADDTRLLEEPGDLLRHDLLVQRFDRCLDERFDRLDERGPVRKRDRRQLENRGGWQWRRRKCQQKGAPKELGKNRLVGVSRRRSGRKWRNHSILSRENRRRHGLGDGEVNLRQRWQHELFAQVQLAMGVQALLSVAALSSVHPRLTLHGLVGVRLEVAVVENTRGRLHDRGMRSSLS